MTNLPHDIMLTLLKGGYSNQNVSLDDVFKKFNPSTSEKLKSAYIKDILNALEDKKYLTWKISRRLPDSDKFAYLESYKNDFASENATHKFYDLADTKISGTIMPEGIDYALEIDRKRVRHRNNNMAIIFSGLTVIITLTTLLSQCNSESQLRQHKLKAQQSKEQLQSLDSIVQTHQTDLNYLIQGRKDDLLKAALKVTSDKKDAVVLKHNPNK